MKKYFGVVLLLAVATVALAWDGAGWDVGKLAVASKTTSFTVKTSDDIYLISTAGGAITATLPNPAGCTGKEWTATLVTAGAAVTWSAAPFSINGSVTDATMDAVGDSFKIICTGTSYLQTSRYIH